MSQDKPKSPRANEQTAPVARAYRQPASQKTHLGHSNKPKSNSRNQAHSDLDMNLARLHHNLRKYAKGKPTRNAYKMNLSDILIRPFSVFVRILCIFLISVTFLIAGIGVGTLFGYIATTTPLPTDLLRAGTQTTFIYDSEGNVMTKFTGKDNVDRIYVPYKDVQDTYLDDAFIAIEDERFETNMGIDPKRILSAVVSALTNRGEATHGGSTITQQTVKLITGNNQRSAQRKVQEWYRAYMLNKQLTKWEIMELYLNLVPMANSYVGVESAARAYFGKPASELNLAECAYLAGIPKSPSNYNPLTEYGRRNGLRRQRIVLSKMHELGRITDEQYHEALNANLIFHKDPIPSASTEINSYFTEYVINQVIQDLKKQNDYSEDLARQIIMNSGVKIYSTMEPSVQSALDTTFQKRELFSANYDRIKDLPEFPEAGMAVINNQTGAIAAMQGGYGTKKTNFSFNRATDTQRQPGSVTKPINIYAPAMELNRVTGATILDDKKVFLDPDNPNEPYPKNAYYPSYRGKMTLRNAVKISNNVPAALVLQTIGFANSKLYLKEVGIDRTKDPARMAMAVGAYGTGMSPLEIASAFSVFPNGGIYKPHYAYTRVEEAQGNILLENTAVPKQVYRPTIAFMMTKVLEETVLGRTSSFPYEGSAYGYGFSALSNAAGQRIGTAGKTGTSDEDVDKWFCGFTPYYTGAVWYGYDNRISKTSVITPDGPGAVRIWFDAMKQVHANKPPADWTQPSGIVPLRICIRSGQLAKPGCGSGNTITEYFEANSPLTPTTYCPVH